MRNATRDAGLRQPSAVLRFPYEPRAVDHKHGGTITRITGIGHEVARPSDGYSRDVWYFVGDVTWRSGPKSTGIQIAPWAICCDEDGQAEVRELMRALTEYLNERGEWCDSKSGHEGWFALDRGALTPSPELKRALGRIAKSKPAGNAPKRKRKTEFTREGDLEVQRRLSDFFYGRTR